MEWNQMTKFVTRKKQVHAYHDDETTAYSKMLRYEHMQMS